MRKSEFKAESIKVDVSVDGVTIGSVEMGNAAQSGFYKEQAVFYKAGYIGNKYSYRFSFERRMTKEEEEQRNKALTDDEPKEASDNDASRES